MASTRQVFTLEDVDLEIDGKIVGGAQSVSVKWEQQNEPKYQSGSKKPFEIRDGQVAISGSIEQFFLDADMINDLHGLNDGNNPYFNIIGITKNKTPKRKVIIVDAKFKGFSLEFGLTDDTKTSRDFDALDIIIK